MDVQPRCHDKVVQMISKGINIPNPLTLDVGDEVDPGRISGEDVTIYPGCRIYGAGTVISAGARIGQEGPVTIDDCQLGPKVELKGGYFRKAVFLDRASMGAGAHVREGCILEEEAGGAHCVGIKQTILFPFVTLGSLINFCDCLMAGGTSRKDHSEVGSSYIHFNFTPEGDKATASLIGDVPRGVMLNQPRIFLGGQGGLVGPLVMGYGNVVAANCVLRNDFPGNNKLIVGKTHPPMTTDYKTGAYPTVRRIVENNITYIANLVALEEWYIHVRRSFLESRELGRLIFLGVMEKLALAKEERLKRLRSLAEKARTPGGGDISAVQDGAGKNELADRFWEVEAVFASAPRGGAVGNTRDDFLSVADRSRGSRGGNYIDFVMGFDTQTATRGTLWLQEIVDACCRRVRDLLPSLKVFEKRFGTAAHE